MTLEDITRLALLVAVLAAIALGVVTVWWVLRTRRRDAQLDESQGGPPMRTPEERE